MVSTSRPGVGSRPTPRTNGTAERILDVAEQLVQRRGFNAFSYADVATELRVTKASLHYHFPSKAQLGEALITRYASGFAAALAEIDRCCDDAPTKLRRYADLYARVLQQQRMCLCGMLAAEYDTLPDTMRQAVLGFFHTNEVWLEGVLTDGRDHGALRFEGAPREQAQLVIGTLEGALLVARSFGDPDRLRRSTERLLQLLGHSN